MIDVSIVGSLVYIRHKHKVTSTILAAYDYEQSKPENLIEPGLISDRERKKINPVRFYENKDYICYYKDKQFWICLKYMKANSVRRKLWKEYKDTGECWLVPADLNNRGAFFRYKNEALNFIKVSGRTVRPKHISVCNPEDIKCVIKMPWVSLLLEDYDVAKEWDEYTFDKYEYTELSDWIEIIKAFRKWEIGNEK